MIHRAIEAAAEIADADTGDAELAVMLTDDAGIRTLNSNWRGIDKPTNVLSFPALQPTGGRAATTCRGCSATSPSPMRPRGKEADDEAKPFDHHLSHLAVHGFLHLIGYDHENDDDAEAMEGLEREILAQLGIPDPYADAGADGLKCRTPIPTRHAQGNPRNTRNLPAVVQEGEVLRPAADNWLTARDPHPVRLEAGIGPRRSAGRARRSTPDEVGFSAIERTMLRNILGLHERRIADVMVHRADIVAVKRDIPLGELMSLFESAAHSRLVVYNETLDDPEGIVHIRDLLAFMTAKARVGDTSKPQAQKAASRRDSTCAPSTWRCRWRTPTSSASCCYVPPSMRAIDLLAQMQASRIHLALVVDEYGGTDGLVSIEDIVEQIVGEIDDEHDSDEPPAIVRQADNSFIADARASLDDVRTMIGEEFVTGEAGEEVETLGGYLVAHVGRLPVRGEVISGPGNFEIEVLDADPRRVKRLRIAVRKERPAPRTAARTKPPRDRARSSAAAGQRQCAADLRRRSRFAVKHQRQTPRRRSFDHPVLGMEARGHRAGGGRAVGAGDGAVQCLAGAVPDLSGRGLADRRRGAGEMARRAGGRIVRLLVRARLFRAGAVLDRLRLPGRCADIRLADAVCGAGPAGLSRAVHRAGLRAGATDLDHDASRVLALAVEPDSQRMAARPSADRLSLECLRLRAVGTAGAGADRLADRAVGHDVPCGRDLREPGRPDRRRLAGAKALDRAGSGAFAAAGDGRFRRRAAVAAADRDVPGSSCASCSPTCSRTSNSIMAPSRR